MPRSTRGSCKRKAIRTKRKRTWIKEHCRQWVRNLRTERWELPTSDPGEEADDESEDSGLGSDDDEWSTTMDIRVTLLPPEDPFQSVRETIVDNLCSEESRLGPNEAVKYLIFLFTQTDTSSRITKELLRGQTINDLSRIVESVKDFVRFPGYDYPDKSADGVITIGGPGKELKAKWENWRHDWVRINRLRLVPWRVVVFRRHCGDRIVGAYAYTLKYPLEAAEVDREILPCGCPLYPAFSWDYLCSGDDLDAIPPVNELLDKCSMFADEEEGLFLFENYAVDGEE